jgi:hypothetical protein
MKPTTTIQIIEIKTTPRDYGMAGTQAVVDHPKHGRLLIEDGFGGMDQLRGGCVRWEHGSVYQLQPGDTISSLEAAEWNDNYNGLQAVVNLLDDSRPYLQWDGSAIAAVSKKAGL